MPTVTEIENWAGRDVVGPDGEKIGRLDHLYVDRETGDPTFVAVKTGLFGMRDSLVPVTGALSSGDEAVTVAYDKATVKDAPNVEADGELSEAEESRLYEHYGIGGYASYDGPDHADLARRERARDAADTVGRDTVGRDTSGPETDTAMTRSEEELHVGTTRREAGRARLRKYVVTENVTRTVPVQREEVRVEREPITDANAGAATDGPAISDEEHEVVLHEEQVVTDKTVVPKERVRMDVDTRTDEVEVDEELRRERIDVDGDTPGTR